MKNLASGLLTTFSLLLGIGLIFLSEGISILPTSGKHTLKLDVEHNIILDLTSKTDKVIYDNLVFSSYYCSKINSNKAKCSQFNENEEQILTSVKHPEQLYSYTSADGQALRVYKTKNGAAHFEFQEGTQGLLKRYTFTSVEKASDFASQNQDLFKTENSDWDLSYLDYIL